MTTSDQVLRLLQEVNEEFVPKLSDRLDLKDYSKKIVERANIFSLHINGDMAGFVGLYCNDTESLAAYLPMLVVGAKYRGIGIAENLVCMTISHLKRIGFAVYRLEVYRSNERAISLYQKLGFIIIRTDDRSHFMELTL